MSEFPIIEISGDDIAVSPDDPRLDCAGRLYLVDLEGHERRKPSLGAIESCSRGGRREVWVDAAPLDPDDIIDMLIAGAGAIVVRQGGRYWRDVAIEAISIAERVVVWFETLNGEGAAQEVRWFLEKGVADFVIWKDVPSPLPEGGRYYSRRRGTVEGCPEWMRWKLVEVQRDATADRDR
ncbi:MAG TPA: hypothetical protein EYP43_02925 [Thermoplasmata archaeon]|nr:hypothetical protein [Thermoplasmata archaeon]